MNKLVSKCVAAAAIASPAIVASTLAVAMVVAPARAGVSPVEAPSVIVAYRDLDLSRSGGRTTLDGRLRRAAISVCPSVYGAGPAETQIARSCRKRALSAAREEAAFAALKTEGRLAAR